AEHRGAGGREHVETVDEPEHAEHAAPQTEHECSNPVQVGEATGQIAPDVGHTAMVTLTGHLRQSTPPTLRAMSSPVVLSAGTVVTADAVLRPGWVAVDGATVRVTGGGPPPDGATELGAAAIVVPG